MTNPQEQSVWTAAARAANAAAAAEISLAERTALTAKLEAAGVDVRSSPSGALPLAKLRQLARSENERRANTAMAYVRDHGAPAPGLLLDLTGDTARPVSEIP